MPSTHTDKLDDRFDLRLDDETRNKLDSLSRNSNQSRSKIIRILIIKAKVEDIKDAE